MRRSGEEQWNAHLVETQSAVITEEIDGFPPRGGVEQRVRLIRDADPVSEVRPRPLGQRMGAEESKPIRLIHRDRIERAAQRVTENPEKVMVALRFDMEHGGPGLTARRDLEARVEGIAFLYNEPVLRRDLDVPVINGLPFLTGLGIKEVIDTIEKTLTQGEEHQ